jgi:cytidylate kinase
VESILLKPKIIIVNGPAGVGKTTISRKLAVFGDNSACIHGDDFRGYIVNRQVENVATGLGYKNGATVASNFIQAGYDLVVYEYVFEDETHIPKFMNHIAVESLVYFITLWADQESVIDREKNRSGRARLGDRVAECYQTMQKALGSIGWIVNTSNKTPDEVVKKIWGGIQNNKGRIALEKHF